MSVIIPLVIVTILILLNGVFVAAEFAIIGVRPTRIRQLAEQGNSTAKWALKVISDRGEMDRYVATSQLGITLASLGLGMYGEPAISHVIGEPVLEAMGLEGEIVHTISFLFALLLITYLHVVVGEMIPKSMALQNAANVVLALASPMRVIERIFAIPVRLLNNIGLAVLRLLRIPPPDEGSRAYAPDELEMIVTESYAGGLLEEYEQELVENIFDFAERRVGQVMTPRPEVVALPTTVDEDTLLKTLMGTPFSRMPVYEGDIDNISGVLHLKEVVRWRLSGKPFDLPSLLYQATFVPETLPADRLLANMRATHQHIAIVIDEYGGTVGVVTMEDLLEEVVGELQDEFEVVEPPLVVTRPGHVVAQGAVLLDEVRDVVPLPETEHAVDTIGGLVVAELGRVPEEGAVVELDQVTLRVEAVDGRAVKRVSLRFEPGEST